MYENDTKLNKALRVHIYSVKEEFNKKVQVYELKAGEVIYWG